MARGAETRSSFFQPACCDQGMWQRCRNTRTIFRRCVLDEPAVLEGGGGRSATWQELFAEQESRPHFSSWARGQNLTEPGRVWKGTPRRSFGRSFPLSVWERQWALSAAGVPFGGTGTLVWESAAEQKRGFASVLHSACKTGFAGVLAPEKGWIRVLQE